MTQQAEKLPKQLLAIGYVWPEPNSSAAGKHMLSLLKSFIAAGYQVCFASPAIQTEHKIDLTELGIEEASIELNHSSFDQFVANLNPQIVLFDRFMMEEQFSWRVAQNCPNALRILDTEDLHFLRDARHKAHKQSRQVSESDLKSDMAMREIAAIYRCDLSLIISEYEMNVLQQQFSVPSALLHYCPFMLDIKQLKRSPVEFSQRQHFVSIGNFRHAPNWDAVLYLKQTIWPLIRKQIPSAQLHVYGAYPPPKATDLHNPKSGFYVDGWAEDAFSVLQQSRVCIAPLRFGAGLKGKLADAMWTGTPSVTTSIGSQGMNDSSMWPGAIADDPQEIADQAVALYQDAKQWQLASDYGYQLLAQRFNLLVIQQQLLERVDYCLTHLAQLRLDNFTGMMLQHHSHKSTQYMSQWIEAKNANPK
ncbi:glycosyltransferase [Aliiglaciecola lipolytica]|uniref:glycosyltransferase n=1 Tax=Aliiglaciecola lipolytica TaxID=477689 RepID=UPI002090FE89|nr:glycosyltransferase [Aliiglaciecola lipolytica]